MTIRIEPLDEAPPRFIPENNVFLKQSFRTALAREFRLQAINIGFDVEGETRWLPAYQKNTRQLIIGAGFDKTGETGQFTDNNFTTHMQSLVGQLYPSRFKILELRTRNTLPLQKDYSDKVDLTIQLDMPCAERLKQFSRSTRRNLKLPFKHGFHFVIDNTQKSLDDFYQLYLLGLHELGSLPHSRSFFTELLENCKDDIALFVGYIDEKPVIASFLFLGETEIYGAWAGNDPEYKKYSVFLCMLWQIAEYCEVTGRTTFNLGRTSFDSKAYHFKKRLANQEHRIYYYKFDTRAYPVNQPFYYTAASWLIRNTPPMVMKTISRSIIHRFY